MAHVLKAGNQAISGRDMLVAVGEQEVIQLLTELLVRLYDQNGLTPRSFHTASQPICLLHQRSCELAPNRQFLSADQVSLARDWGCDAGLGL